MPWSAEDTERFRAPDQHGPHAPYIPPSPAERGRAGGHTASRRRPVRQRPVRSTLTLLLLIPLISLIALWAYAAVGTIGSAIGKRNSDTINKDVGGPAQVLLLQLAQERAGTFTWQSAHGLVPRTGLDTQRAAHGRRRLGLPAGRAAAGAGAETQATQPEVAALSRELGQLGVIRAEVNAGAIQPLAAFESYNSVVNAFFPFARGALSSPGGSLSLYQQGEGVIDEAQALELIGREATLVGGDLASGGAMTPAEHQLFVQAVNDQRFLEQTAESPFYWQGSADPYLTVFASPAYRNFHAMEDRVAAGGGGRASRSARPPGRKASVGPGCVQSGGDHRPAGGDPGVGPRRRRHPAAPVPRRRGRPRRGPYFGAAAGAVRQPHHPRADGPPHGGACPGRRAPARGRAPAASRRGRGCRLPKRRRWPCGPGPGRWP